MNCSHSEQEITTCESVSQTFLVVGCIRERGLTFQLLPFWRKKNHKNFPWLICLCQKGENSVKSKVMCWWRRRPKQWVFHTLPFPPSPFLLVEYPAPAYLHTHVPQQGYLFYWSVKNSFLTLFSPIHPPICLSIKCFSLSLCVVAESAFQVVMTRGVCQIHKAILCYPLFLLVVTPPILPLLCSTQVTWLWQSHPAFLHHPYHYQ